MMLVVKVDEGSVTIFWCAAEEVSAGVFDCIVEIMVELCGG